MQYKYLENIIYKGINLTNDGKSVEIFELNQTTDDAVLNEWANRFRENYCSDQDIDLLRAGTGKSREEYLRDIKFPDIGNSLGRATRSGDFSEILIADYFEFVLNYFVPRTRYDRKINRNSSPMGSDLIAYKMNDKPNPSDEMLVFEIKAQASKTKPKNKLQEAINHSSKDLKRLAESLNASKQRLFDRGMKDEALTVQRFQNNTDEPYVLQYGAAAVHSKHSFKKSLINEVTIANHIADDILLLVVVSENLMNTIHDIYERACKC